MLPALTKLDWDGTSPAIVGSITVTGGNAPTAAMFGQARRRRRGRRHQLPCHYHRRRAYYHRQYQRFAVCCQHHYDQQDCGRHHHDQIASGTITTCTNFTPCRHRTVAYQRTAEGIRTPATVSGSTVR
jgi:hypothetical protein